MPKLLLNAIVVGLAGWLFTALGLMLPFFLQDGVEMSLFEAMYLSVSIITLTGSEVIHVSDAYNHCGLVFIGLVVQASGIAFVAWLLAMVKDVALRFGKENLVRDVSWKQVLLWAGMMQLVVATMCWVTWGSLVQFESAGYKLLHSWFYAVMSIFHVGIGSLPGELQNPDLENSLLFHIALTLGSLIGAIGVFPLRDVFSRSRLQYRLKNPEHDWETLTKWSVFGGLAILAIGSGALLLVESGNSSTIGELTSFQKMVKSFAFINSARSSGWQYFDPTDLTPIGLVITVVVMLVGAGLVSPSGGIRIPVLMYSVSKMNRAGKVKKALMLSFGTLFVVLSILVATQDAPSQWVLMDGLSAFTNTGFEFGTTAQFGWGGRILMILLMLIGRFDFIAVVYLALRGVDPQDEES